MAIKIIDWKTGAAQTIGAAAGNIILTDDLPDGAVCVIDMTALGRTAGGDVAVAQEVTTVKRQGGVVSIVTTNSLVPFNAGSSAALLGCTLSQSVSGNKVQLAVNGVALQTVEWFASARIYVYQN